MKTLSKRQILMLHRQLVEQTGGSDGIRDEGLLDSALFAPFQSFDSTEVYPSLQQKAARLCFGLVKIIHSLTAISESAPTPCWSFWHSMAWSCLTRKQN